MILIQKPKQLWAPPRDVVMPRSWRRQRGFFVPMVFLNNARRGNGAASA